MSMRHGGGRLDSKQAAKIVVFERRMLMGCTISVAAGLLLWVVSISTEYWFTVSCADGKFINRSGIPGMDPGYLTYSHTGLWRTCKTIFHNGTASPVGADSDHNRNVMIAPAPPLTELSGTQPEVNGTEPEVNGTRPEVNGTERISRPLALVSEQSTTACTYMRFKFLKTIDTEHPLNVVIAYRRTCLAFTVISMLLSSMAIFFSVYTFRVWRYTFKRVAACLHLMVAAVQLVVIEVKQTSVQYQGQNVPSVIPKGCDWNYNASFWLGWICFLISVVAGVLFLYASGKKKKRPEGNTADADAAEDDDDFDDEPQIMGR